MKTKILWLLFFVVQISFAQEKVVSGAVSDESGPLPGVTIIIKGTTKGTETDFDGNYKLNANVNDVLIYSFIGKKTVEKAVTNSTSTINVVLLDGNVLDEIVLTGYSSTTKTKSATAAVVLPAKTLENQPNANVLQSLTGKVAGLDISVNSGQPGAAPNIILRGISSINGTNTPLFVIDGVRSNIGAFNALNPHDIENFTILKDAGATAIYGNEGTNGVIVITTKKGRKNSPLLTKYTSTIGLDYFQGDNIKFMNSQQYLNLERSVGRGYGSGSGIGIWHPGKGSPFTDQEIANTDTFDWQNYFFRPAFSQTHTLSFSKGGESSNQFLSLGYFEQKGTIRNSKFNRFTLRNNVSGSSSNQKLKYSSNLGLSFSKSDVPTRIGASFPNQNYFFGTTALPYLHPSSYTNSADFATTGWVEAYAPYYVIDRVNTTASSTENFNLSLALRGDLEIAKDFTLWNRLSVNFTNSVFQFSEHPISRNSIAFANGGLEDRSSTRELSLINTAALEWKKTIAEDHQLTTTVFFEAQRAHRRGLGFRAWGLDPKTFEPGVGLSYVSATNDDDITRYRHLYRNGGLLSYFGILDYDYKSKYGLYANIRRDASYRFVTTNKWGTFWSVSGRWNIDKEDFMTNSAFNTLKLRAGIGQVGNQQILGGGIFAAHDEAHTLFGSFANQYNNSNSYTRIQIGEADLKWETTIDINLGVDFGAFDNRLRGNLEFYQKDTDGLFLQKPLSWVTGQTTLSANIGEIRNRGVEYNISYDLIRNKNLTLTLRTLGNYNKNTILKLTDDTDEILGIGRVGNEVGEYNNVRYVGVNPVNGNSLALDKDGNLTENATSSDGVWLNKSASPDLYGSFGFDIQYKGFELSSLFDFTVGVYKYEWDYAEALDPNKIGINNLSSDILRHWTPDNRITDIPRLDAQSNLHYGSDKFLKNADFLRLRTLSLSYSVPSNYLDLIGLNSLKFYASGQNLLTFTKFRGYDVSTRRGNARNFPTPRSYNFGIEISL